MLRVMFWLLLVIETLWLGLFMLDAKQFFPSGVWGRIGSTKQAESVPSASATAKPPKSESVSAEEAALREMLTEKGSKGESAVPPSPGK